MATTDARGRFVIQPLPPADYVLRVHLAGFVAGPARWRARRSRGRRRRPIQMHRLNESRRRHVAARPILTAGVTAPVRRESDGGRRQPHRDRVAPAPHQAQRAQTERRRRLDRRRRVRAAGAAPGNPSIFGRAFDNAANMAASFFTATPFSGEVNFLTTSALGAGPLLFSDFVPRGVAYMSIGAPAASGRWDVRASMSQSDVSAWILAGSFTSRIATSHDYGFGVSYSTQQYQNTNARPVALAAVADETRNVGEIYGQRSLDGVAHVRARLRRALRALRLPAAPLAAEPARRLHAHAVHEHARDRQCRAAHARAGRGGVPARGDRRPVAAARADVHAARRGALPRGAGAVLRRRHRARVRRHLRARRAPLPAARRQPDGDAVRPAGQRRTRRHRDTIRSRTPGALDAEGWARPPEQRAVAADPRLGRLQRVARAMGLARRHGGDRRLGAGRDPAAEPRTSTI